MNRNLIKGIFISFEGPDGSGKSTQVKKLAEYLQNNNYSIVMTREPGGTRISEIIRSIILNPDNSEMDPMTEAFLYASSRAQHVAQLIKPSIEEGKIVLCDRFMDSSIAYQGYARGLGDCVRIINEYAVAGMQPDITFFLNVSAEEGMKRVMSNRKLDRLEQEDISFHKAVYDGYIKLKDIYKDRYVIIDASVSEEEVFAQIKSAFEKYVAARA